jgi:outer membrane protein TolC
MRLYQQIRASIARLAVAGAGLFVFVSGIPVSAFGQSQVPTAPTPTTPQAIQQERQGTPLAMDDAVKMALENNLGIQIERLNPQIQVLGISRSAAAYAPTLFSNLSRRNATAPPTDFLSASGSSVVTTGNFTTTGGVQQLLRWGGASYSLSIDGTRGTSNAAYTVFSPQLGSDFNASYTQPLLKNFKIDATRQQLALSQNQAASADIELQQRVTQTARNVRSAYYALIGAISGLDVAQQSLDVARTSLKNNQTRVEVGTMAQIDIVSAEAEVASNEEGVIVAQAQIETAQDQLRTLILNPNQPDFWTARFTPSEQPTLAPRDINVDAAIKNALQNRTDIRDFRKGMDNTDINLAYARNQKLPQLDVSARYGLTGIAGTQFQYGTSALDGSPIITGQNVRPFTSALGDVFGNDFRTWSFGVNLSYPIGTSIADAAYAQVKLQKQQDAQNLANLEMAVTAQVRQAGRDVNTNLRRVESTRRARELAEQKLTADNKRFAVGLASTFEVLQSQRDLARARQSELNAVIDYNRSLVDFEAVQISPIR